MRKQLNDYIINQLDAVLPIPTYLNVIPQEESVDDNITAGLRVKGIKIDNSDFSYVHEVRTFEWILFGNTESDEEKLNDMLDIVEETLREFPTSNVPGAPNLQIIKVLEGSSKDSFKGVATKTSKVYSYIFELEYIFKR